MENNNLDEKREKKKPEINHKNGLNFAYEMEEFKKSYPHLMEEIVDKKQSIKIDSVESQTEQTSEEIKDNLKNCVQSELINPGAIDFIKRCSKNEEAIEILDYLLKRKEISSEEYNKLKGEIMMEGGLKQLIERSGGPKNHGYYINKYYKKKNTDQKFKSSKN